MIYCTQYTLPPVFVTWLIIFWTLIVAQKTKGEKHLLVCTQSCPRLPPQSLRRTKLMDTTWTLIGAQKHTVMVVGTVVSKSLSLSLCQTIEAGEEFPATIATTPKTRPLNRFANITVCEFISVRLSILPPWSGPSQHSCPFRVFCLHRNLYKHQVLAYSDYIVNLTIAPLPHCCLGYS